MMKKNINVHRKGLLLFSGGIDSAAAALLLLGQGCSLLGLSIDYPGRPAGEKVAAKVLSKIIPFSAMIEVSLNTNDMLTVKDNRSSMHEGWIPFRNFLFWAIAAHKAVLQKVNFISGGHDIEDGKIYSDATEEFFADLQKILKYGSGNGMVQNNIDIELPLYFMTDKEVVPIVKDNEEVFSKTWSCWRDKLEQCGKCHACIDRKKFLDQLA